MFKETILRFRVYTKVNHKDYSNDNSEITNINNQNLLNYKTLPNIIIEQPRPKLIVPNIKNLKKTSSTYTMLCTQTLLS